MKGLPLVVTCAAGIEDLLVQELCELGCRCRVLHPGFVLGLEQEGSLDELLRVTALSRLARGVGWHLFSGRVSADLEGIADALAAMDFATIPASPRTSYGVRARRQGNHSFTSVQLASTVAGAIGRAWGRCGLSGLTSKIKAPEFPVEALLDQDMLVVSAIFSGEPKAYRQAPLFRHHAALDPTLAAAMLRESSFRERRVVLDPMCGGGTILWEAAMALSGTSPWYGSPADPPLVRQSWFDAALAALWRELLTGPDGVVRGLPAAGPRLIGADRYGGKVAGARRNLEHLGFAQGIELHVGSAATLGYVEPGEIDAVVVNPPYGIRVSNPREADALYGLFAIACAAKRIDQVTTISPRKGPLLDAFARASYRPDVTRQVMFGEMRAFMVRFVRDF